MRNHVLVYVQDGLVRDDVVATVRDVHLNAAVQIVEDVEAACKKLYQLPGWAWAVLSLSSAELEREDLRVALKDNEALPVVLSARPAGSGLEDWVFLDPPFTTRMLAAALERTRPF